VRLFSSAQASGAGERYPSDVLDGPASFPWYVVQHPHRPPVMRLPAHEVVAQDMVGVLRAQPHARPVVEPQPPAWLLPLWNLQSLTTPDPLHPVFADLPACPLEQRRDPAVSITAILTGQRDNGLSKRVFVVSLRRPVALACRVAASPHGTPAARSSHAHHAHGSPHSAVV